jgi:hypothetical protein
MTIIGDDGEIIQKKSNGKNRVIAVSGLLHIIKICISLILRTNKILYVK